MIKDTIRSAAWLWWGLTFSNGIVYAEEQDLTMAQIEQRRERLRQEAVALFPRVLNGKLQALDHCQISSSWLSWEIDEWDAEKYFGVKAHASLSAPDHGTVPAKALDPQGLYAKIFCNKGETEANDKQRFMEFEKAFASDKTARLTNAQWSYTFPVFNEDYTRAAIVAQDEGRTWWDPREAGNWEGGNSTEIYEKRNGIWELLAESGGNHWEGSAPPLSGAANNH